MNISRLVLILIALTFYSFSGAQTTITGTVVTAKNEPVEGANIILKTLDDQTTLAFTSSSKDGTFTLSAKPGTYLLKITYIGYLTVHQEIIANSEPLILYTITIIEDTSELEAVFLKAEAKIIQKGDTTIYNTEKFLNGTEQNLGDVLQIIPGMGISNNGKVTVGGKEVDRFLIDGEDLYKNQHKFGTENISSNIIGNIELIRNYTDFETLKTENKSGITALNVNIKDEFKNKITGTIDAAAGIINKYAIKPSLFNFGKRNKTSIITNFNNTGNSSISIQDYLEITNPVEVDNSASAVIFSKNDDIPKFLTSENKAKSRVTNFATLSSIFNYSKNLKIDFYSIFNQTKQEHQFLQEQILNTTGEPIMITNRNNIDENNLLGIAHLKTIYKKNNSVFSFTSKLNFDLSNLNTDYENENNQAQNFINEKYKPKKLNSKTNASFSHRLNNAVLNSKLFLNYNSHSDKLTIFSNRQFLDLDFGIDEFQLSQTFRKQQTQSGIDLKYAYTKNKISFQIGASTAVENNELESLNNSSLILENDLNLTSLKSILNGYFTYRFSGIYSYSIGLEHNYNLLYFNEKSAKQRFTNFNTKLKAGFSPNNIAELSYGYSHQTPTIENLIQNELVVNYRNTILNKDVAYNSLFPYHHYNYQHFLFNPKKKISFIFNASHKRFEQSINSNVINNENLTTTQYKLINQDKSTSFLVFLEKQFAFLPVAISNSTSLNYFENEYFQDGISETFTSRSIGGFVELKSRFKSSPIHFNVGYKYSFDKYFVGNFNSTARREHPYLNLNGNITKTLFWNLDNSYKKYVVENNGKGIYYLSPGLRFSEKRSNWEFSIIGENILNLNNNNILESIVIPGLTEKRITSILPGNVLFKIKYKF